MTNNSIECFLQEQFTSRFPRSRYFNEGGLLAYLRAGPYHYDPVVGTRHTAVGIASVNALQPGNGCFSVFLRQLEALAANQGYEFLRVEQVLNPRLQVFLRTQGYAVLEDGTSEEVRLVNPVMFKSIRVPALQSTAIDPEREAFNTVWVRELTAVQDQPMTADTMVELGWAIWRRAKQHARPIADVFQRQTHVGTAWTYAEARGGLTFTSRALALEDALAHGYRES